MSENNWRTQLRKIEREFDGLPPEPSPGAVKFQSEVERRAQQRTAERAAALGAAARLFLVLALGAGLSLWPYSRDCGQGLFIFIGVEAVFVAGALWIASYTWRHRLPRMHALALLVMLSGLILIAAEVLPRTGYAAADPQNPPQWSCAQ